MHHKDTFSLTTAMNPESGAEDFILRRLDMVDPLITKDNFTLLKSEAMVFFDTLLNLPEFEERAIGALTSKNKVRISHPL